jgi:hypothetical protein
MREIAEGKGEASYACHRAALRSRTSSSETVSILIAYLAMLPWK